MKFRAKPTGLDKDWSLEHWTDDYIDEEGYIHGYYVDGYIVGDVVDATDECINLSFWWPVDKDSVEVVK
ncbi:hypothetical protein ACI1S3_05945 [Lactococcus garvieae]|uniref:hypothetical protein n=1 Tax=Lactococcus garvieae TaxID=1363 RepID=UPI0032556D35